MECLFCNIVSGAIKSYKVFEDKLVFTFLDIHPWSKGHTLIIPKKHSLDITDIDDISLKRVITVAKQLANSYDKKLGATGFNLLNSSGAVAQQDVFHFHLHLIPRYDNDGLRIAANNIDEKIDIDTVFAAITKSGFV